MKFNQRGTALIIGGSSGMGLESAKLLLAQGVDVVIVANNDAKLQRALGELQVLGNANAIQANLYNRDSLQKVLDYINREDTQIGYLLNAAGYFSPKPFLEHSEEDYETYMGLNKATYVISQAVAANMVRNGGGNIVNVGSMWGQQ